SRRGPRQGNVLRRRRSGLRHFREFGLAVLFGLLLIGLQLLTLRRLAARVDRLPAALRQFIVLRQDATEFVVSGLGHPALVGLHLPLLDHGTDTTQNGAGQHSENFNTGTHGVTSLPGRSRSRTAPSRGFGTVGA